MALAIPTRVEWSCLRLRTLDFSGSLVVSVNLMTAIGNGVVLYGFGVFDGTAAASVPRSNGLVLHASAVSLPSSLLGSVPVTAVITPPETVGPANPGTASQASPHGKNPGSGPNTATLPSGKKQYQTGLGLEGINGTESACFQPVFGTNNSPFGCLPPDVTMSASSQFVMEEVNTAGKIWTTSGQVVKFFTLTDFFTVPSGAGCFLTDPQVYFDNGTQRWFTSILSVTCGALNTQQPDVSSQIYLGVSQTSDPSGSWFEYVIPNPLPLNLADQPFLGVNDHVVVISTNQFLYSAFVVDGFTGAYFWVLDKLALEQVGCTNPAGLFCSVTFQTFGPFGNMASIHPAHSYGPSPTEYMAGVFPPSHGESGVDTLNFFAVDGTPPQATVSITNLTIRPMAGPPFGDQPGMPQSLETNDGRITTGVYQDDVTWWGANAGCTVPGGSSLRSCIRLIEVTTTSGTYAVAQDFDFSSGKDEDVYFPGITLDPAGDLTLTYAFSSLTTDPSMAVTLKLASQTKGVLEPPTVVVAGKDTEQGGRYGDYCDASPSYSDPREVWLACEYIANFNDFIWNTHVQQLFVVG